jgi:DNA helicase HerA-like ATPase
VDERFETDLRAGYPDGASGVVLGSPMLDGEVLADVRVRLPLSTVNRHGLVAGATGTGKPRRCR